MHQGHELTAGKFGRLDVKGHTEHRRLTGETIHVFLDGVDVTKSCYEADDIEGYVRLFCRDQAAHRDWTAKGAIHLASEGAGACRLHVIGKVEFKAGEPL